MNKKVLSIAVTTLISASAYAQTPGYWKDSSGNFIKDSSGSCVMTGLWNEAEHGRVGCDADSANKGRSSSNSAASNSGASSASSSSSSSSASSQKSSSNTQKEASAKEKKSILEKLRSISLSSGAAFESGSSTLSSAGKKNLDELASQLKVLGGALKGVQVDGHTDNTGSDAVNQRISEKRAAAVKDYLVSKGVNGSKINTKGYGESKPVADNSTAAGRAENRRVEVKVSGDIVETIKN